jgi:hypothetical protein
MGVMVARRLRFTVAALLCGLGCVLGGAVAPAMAEISSIGEFGEEAGQFKTPSGVAVDRSTGAVYVPDRFNTRVEKFASSGAFLLGWGWVVNASEPRIEFQTCTAISGCRRGNSSFGAGGFSEEGPQGVAVDNNSSVTDSSSGDVYVVDPGSFRVEKFDPQGKFLLMFGGGVNKKGTNVCTAAEAGECQRGTSGTGNGQITRFTRLVAVGPGGLVYVGDKARVDVFEPSGAWRENISLVGLSAEGGVTALAVNSAGDLFVKDEGVPGVREIEPGGIEAPVKFDVGSETVEALAVDGSGDLFVADGSGAFHLAEYAIASGEELESFGSRSGVVNYGVASVAVAEALNELYATNSGERNVRVLPLPKPGPLFESGSETAVAGLHGTATLEAVLNSEGNETTYHFEYIDQARFEAGGYSDAVNTPTVALAAGFEDQAVSADLSKLTPAVYHYRIVVTNSKGTVTGPDQTFTTVPFEGPWASGAAGTSVTLAARVNPLGSAAEYRIEYGTSAAYGQTLSGSLGEGSEYVEVARHLQELQPGTEYHYRLLVVNEFGAFEGADHVFTTQVLGSALALPDGRAWELVSPADKKGALIDPLTAIGREMPVEAASSGRAITYGAIGPHVGEDPQDGRVSQVFSTRGANGWSSQDITGSARTPVEGEPDLLLQPEQIGYSFFSDDLSSAVLYSQAPRAAGVREGTLYFRDNSNRSFSALVSEANVAPGTAFGGGTNPNFQMHVLAVTPDLRHVVFESPFALVEPAISKGEAWNLYEWSAGRIQLVSILPDGSVATGAGGQLAAMESPVLGGEEEPGEKSTPKSGVARAVSSDGRRVAWTWGSAYGAPSQYRGLYVRDMVEGRTVRVGGLGAKLQMINADGSRVFYVEQKDLYEYDYATGTATDLTAAHGQDEPNAGVQQLVLGANEDGSTVYFVANGVLSAVPNSRGERATPGHCVNATPVVGHNSPPGVTCNLYLLHNNGSAWEQPRFITTLSGEDEPSWYAHGITEGATSLPEVSSRVSGNGRYLAFMSERPLTGYDNTDAFSGQPDEEVYLYDSMADRLVCVSCNPTGARPVGVHDLGALPPLSVGNLLVDRGSDWFNNGARGPGGRMEGHWLAGSLPGWDEYGGGVGSNQPRFLSDDGRVFFNSPDALVPQATNGLEDVYEYEPPAGPGLPASDTCTTRSVSYSARSGGCVSLVSSGISSSESVFYDASESGDDVFFLTASRLVGEDYDSSFDVYDAHVCSPEVPCRSEVVSPPPCTSGDSCKPAPAPQPEIFGAAPSATFSGVGNVIEEPKKATPHKVVKRKGRHQKRKRKGRRARKSVVGGARKVRK